MSTIAERIPVDASQSIGGARSRGVRGPARLSRLASRVSVCVVGETACGAISSHLVMKLAFCVLIVCTLFMMHCDVGIPKRAKDRGRCGRALLRTGIRRVVPTPH